MRKTNLSFLFISLLVVGALMPMACANKPADNGRAENIHEETMPADSNIKTEKATFGMGCFWHSEEMFSELRGVVSAVPGYAGGTEKNPSYEQVSTGDTRYAESVDVTYDPSKISYAQLLEVFFKEHNPTTPNYSAPDEGPQYRSVIFYRNAEQKKLAEQFIAQLTANHMYKNKIVTEVSPFTTFYRAEDYHIHYYRLHPDQSYIANVTRPEVEKFRMDFKDWLK